MLANKYYKLKQGCKLKVWKLKPKKILNGLNDDQTIF